MAISTGLTRWRSYRPSKTVIVDESESRGYFLAVVAIQPGVLSRTRKELNGMRRPGQRRLHFTRERESSRRQLAGPIARLPVAGIVYVVRGADDKTARTACMRAMLTDAVDAGATRTDHRRRRPG